jgi:hypothetical protein
MEEEEEVEEDRDRARCCGGREWVGYVGGVRWCSDYVLHISGGHEEAMLATKQIRKITSCQAMN